MATSIFFLGRTIATPGSYTEVDASGLEQVGLGAAGIVALIGEGEGGIPVSAIDNGKDLQRVNSPENARGIFRSGDMREAGSMIFEPSSDPAILAGAQEVVFCKVNPATQSTAQLSNGFGPVIDLTSADYGAFTEQINVSIGNGSVAGKLITVIFEDTTETADNVGGTDIFTLQYLNAATTYDTMVASVTAGGIVSALGTRTEAGLDTEITPFSAGPSTVEIPANVDNAGRVVTVYGVAAGLPAREQLVVSGSVLVVSSTTFDEVWGVTMDQVAVTSAVVIDETGGLGQFDIAIGSRETGARICQGMFVANRNVAIASDATDTGNVQVWGRNAGQQIVGETIVLSGTANRATLGVGTFAEIDAIVLGDIPNATDNVTLTANAVVSDPTVQTNIQRIGDLYNARLATYDVNGNGTADTDLGFDFVFVTGVLGALATTLDEVLDVDVFAAATGSFKADTQAVIDFFNFNSTLVDAALSTFTPQIDRITIDNVVNTTLYVFEIDGVDITYLSDGTATEAEINAGLIAATNNHPAVNYKVVATAGTLSSDIDLTGRFGAGFTTTESDANLSLAFPQAPVGAQVVPSNTIAPVFLQGGGEGTTTFTDWQKAFNLLKQVRVNSLVPLTGDPAVHAAADAHAQFMGGIGRSERDVFVGLSALGAQDVPLNTLPTKTSIKSQIVNINSRHTRAFAQSIEKFNTAGEREVFLPWFQAVIAAGMQAGSPVGTSLTFKFGRVLAIDQDSSWNPIDDSEEMIQGGLVFMENVEGVGRRFVRNVTTFLQSDNIAFTEGSVNEAVNFATFNFRTNLEIAVGARGFAGTLNAAKSVALNTLTLLVDAGAITSFRSLLLDLIVDVLEVSVEIAPIIPINFVKSTVHLVTVQQSA